MHNKNRPKNLNEKKKTMYTFSVFIVYFGDYLFKKENNFGGKFTVKRNDLHLDCLNWPPVNYLI